MDAKELSMKYAEIVARTWDDVDYREKFLEDPTRALKEAGFKIPDGVDIVIDDQPNQLVWAGNFNTDEPNKIVLPLPGKNASVSFDSGGLQPMFTVTASIPGSVQFTDCVQFTDTGGAVPFTDSRGGGDSEEGDEK